MGETCLDIRLCSCASLKHFPNHRTSIYSQTTTPGHNKVGLTRVKHLLQTAYPVIPDLDLQDLYSRPRNSSWDKWED